MTAKDLRCTLYKNWELEVHSLRIYTLKEQSFKLSNFLLDLRFGVKSLETLIWITECTRLIQEL